MKTRKHTKLRRPSHRVRKYLRKTKQHAHRLGILLVLIGAAAFIWPQIAKQQGTTGPNLQYLGAFRMPPNGSTDATSFAYGGTGIGYNPNNNSLFVVGHDHHQQVSEISIPTPVISNDLNSLPRATLLQPFQDVTDGRMGLTDPDQNEGKKIGGTFVHNNKLHVAVHTFYDGAGNAEKSHFTSGTAMSTSTAQGPYKVSSEYDPGFVGGYMIPIPPSYQAELGGKALTGLFGVSIVSRSSFGPALFAFDPDTVGVQDPAPAIPLVVYPQDHQATNFDADWSLTNFFNAVTKKGAGGYIDADNEKIYVAFTQGIGNMCYKGDELNCDDNGGYNVAGGNYQPGLLGFNLDDLVRVKNGQMQPWEVRPTDWNPLDFTTRASDSADIGGVTFDQASGKLYVSQLRAVTANFDASPIMHVYQTNSGQAGTPAPTATATPTATAAPSGQPLVKVAPALPAPTGSVVNVSNVSQLQSAVANLQTGQTIMIAAGTYDLTDTLYVPQNISNWAIRGATGNRDQVIIQGNGMEGSVRFGFWIGTSTNGIIADLTLDSISEHGVIANPGAHDMLYHNLKMIDIGDQFIKSNPSGSTGNRNGIVEYSSFEYTTYENNGGTDRYTNAIDIHAGDGWIIRHNYFKNILHAPGQGIAGPAVLAWNGSRNTVVEGNAFVNVARGISLGLVDHAALDHQGGVIRNNMFYRSAGLASSVDVPIYVADSPDTKILNNTVITSGSYPNAIEYRYGSTTGAEIRYNLTDAAIQARDGATATVAGNVTNAQNSWFQDITTGDLHLKTQATAAINTATTHVNVATDYDLQTRPAGNAPDIGADEYGATATVTPTATPTPTQALLELVLSIIQPQPDTSIRKPNLMPIQFNLEHSIGSTPECVTVKVDGVEVTSIADEDAYTQSGSTAFPPCS